MRFTRLWPNYRYSVIKNEDGLTKATKFMSTMYILTTFLCLSWKLLVAICGIYIGRSSLDQVSPDGVKLDITSKSFTYNGTFSDPRSRHTDQAWRDLFPSTGTFFSHPTIAPTIAVYSVFHQLHCLNGIRQGYWAAHRLATVGGNLSDNDSAGMGSEIHVQHCLDLLRQTLMCHADTTVEAVDQVSRGVTGFGVEHQCRNFEQLKHWTEEWHFH